MRFSRVASSRGSLLLQAAQVAARCAGPTVRALSRGGGRMVNPQMVMYEEEFNQIQTVVDRLVRDANAKVVFIVDKNGQLIAASGDIDNVDTTSLASLTAGNIAATGGMAKLLKENEFAT